MSVATILLVGGDESVTTTVRDVADSTRQCRLETVAGIDSAFARLRRGDVGLILVWLADPTAEKSVVGLLQSVSKSPAPTPAIVLCEQGSARLSRLVLRAGAVDCMSRPLDVSRLALLTDIFTVRARYQQQTDRRGPKHPPAGESGSVDFALGTSALGDFMERLHLVAPLDTTILITGETGTGKTHLARVIHDASGRKGKPFVTVPCGAISATLIESEMFGHVRGAFTHAEQDRTGKFSAVEDGTLLLDEIDCVPLESQAKLLRAFEERVFEPVGSNASELFRGRLIAASNQPLAREVAAKRFRSDLYYRINVIEFCIPPLRERPQMVRPLAEKFAAFFSPGNHRPLRGFSDAAFSALEAYDWPGNVRELRNVVERTLAFCPGRTIEVRHLPEELRGSDADLQRIPNPDAFRVKNGNGLAEARSSAERGRLLQALRRNNNNRSRAARELGVSRVTLYKKLHKYGFV